ncbi:MAG: hypothetical protein IT349_12330 [Candidatus Eisenbacteria bacterium]|nr:hypothetical protein [Candidatus Eisenbacteria bacterium]
MPIRPTPRAPEPAHRRGSLLRILLLAGLLFTSRAAAPALARETASEWVDSTYVARWQAGSGDRLVRAGADSTRIDLGVGWIRPDAFALFHRDTLLVRGVDYLLDPRAGWLRLLRAYPRSTAFRARYVAFPLAIGGEYRRYRPTLVDDSNVAAESLSTGTLGRRERAGGQAGNLDDPARLDLSGSKTFAVEVGSQQDLRLRQSLDLTVRGRIARDVNVKAILTDRDTPLEPEGTSTTLSDLDRVLFEVEGPRARMTMGDFLLELPTGEFGRVERQLEGVDAVVRPGPAILFATAATAPGEFTTVEFNGEEGKQGPYRLVEARLGISGAIVGGSERVTLDGVAMARGETEDYVIDYADGTLSFTGRRVITAYSRISVDYQVRTDAYRRGVYGGGGGIGPLAAQMFMGGPLSAPAAPRSEPNAVSLPALPSGSAATERPGIALVWLTERDDRDRPLEAPLSAAEKESLRAAGDSLTNALRSGVRYLGPGLGDYEQVENDTLLTPFFLYVGPEQGAWQVRFDFVGAGNGDYADTTGAVEEVFFRFVGRKRGDYLAGREVARPQATSLVSLAGRGHALGGQYLRAELALSEFDQNLLSGRDDGDNRGAALSLASESAPLRLGAARLSLQATHRRVDRRFRALGRTDPAFFGLDWNLDPARLRSGDRRFGLGTALEVRGTRAAVEWQTLDNQADWEGERFIAEGSGPLPRVAALAWSTRWSTARTRDERAATRVHGRRTVGDAGLALSGRTMEARLRYRQERTRLGSGPTRDGEYFHEGALRVGSGRAIESWRGAVEWIERHRSTYEGAARVPRDRGQTAQFDLSYDGTGGGSAAVNYALRRLAPSGGGPTQTSQVGSLRWQTQAAGEAVRQDGRLELSSLNQRRREKEIRRVAAGEGHYDSLGVYQGVGDYEVIYREGQEEERRNRLEASLRSELDLERRYADAEPDSGPLPLRLWRSLRCTQSWTLTADADRGVEALIAKPGRLVRADLALPAVRVEVRSDLAALPRARYLSPRLRWDWRRGQTEVGPGAREEEQRNSLALRLRSRPRTSWSFDLEPELEREVRVLVRDQSRVSTGWRSGRLRLDQDLALRGGVALGVDSFVRRRERIGAPERATIWETQPTGIWTPNPRTRLELGLTRTSVGRSGAAGRPDRALERSGWQARLLGSVRLRTSLDLSAFLREQRPDHGRLIRDGRMELRATF